MAPSRSEQTPGGCKIGAGRTDGVQMQRSEVLCGLLVFLCFAGPGRAAAGLNPTDDAKAPTSILVIGRPDLPDDDFADSVILVMNNLGPGTAGVILNRPTKMEVSQLFPDIKRLAQLHDRVYFGGPVDIRAVWFLIRAATPPEHAVKACDGVYLSADRKLLLKLLGRDRPMEGLRIFIGHSAWAPGQLEAEIDDDDWTLDRARPDAIFNGKSEHPWPGPGGPESST
jgi:putative transcriptional regulator